MSNQLDPQRYIIARLAEGLYAIDARHVIEMQGLTHNSLAPHPHGGDLVRGVARVRGRVVPVIDVRRRMGLTSLTDEVLELDSQLAKREGEHLAWVEDLKASIRERRAFTGATNPHACAFGRWFDNYEPANATVGALVRRFNEPHQGIHGSAIKVQECMADGNVDGALAIADRAITELFPEMASLFKRVRGALKDTARENVVYVTANGVWRGLAVDAVESVSPLLARRDADAGTSPFVKSIGSLPGRDEAVYHLDLLALLGGKEQAA